MKRILSMLLAIVMVVSMIPVAVSAEEFMGWGVENTLNDEFLISASYTAEAAGTVTIASGNPYVLVEYEGSTATETTVTVLSGDTVEVNFILNAEKLEEDAVEVGEEGIAFTPTATFVPESQPIDLSNVLSRMSPSTTVTVAAGKTQEFYAYGLGGFALTITGEDGNYNKYFVCTGNMVVADKWSITNNTEADATYTMTLSAPVGSYDNPEVISTMEYSYFTANTAEGAVDGYYYTYTAPADGTVVLYFSEVPGTDAEYDENGDEVTAAKKYVCDIVVQNGSVQKTLLLDGVDNYGLELQLDVSAGDVLMISVIAVQDLDGNSYPAAEMTWVGNFVYPAGTVQNPIEIEWDWDDAWANAAAAVAVDAGKTMYFTGDSGMALTVNGVETEQSETGVFSITNSGTTKAYYALALTTPVGQSANPEVIDYLNFEDTHSLLADDNFGYYYTWTATEDATVVLDVTDGANINASVVIGISEEGWPVTENYVLAETNDDWSEWIVAENITLDVKAGQEVKIQVNALTNLATWAVPAIDYTLTVQYPAGSEKNPIDLTNDLIYEEDYTATVTVPAGATLYFCAYRLGGMTMTINDGEGVVCGGDMFTPHTWSITNEGEEAAEYTIAVAFPVGSYGNPEAVFNPSYIAVNLAANSESYYYLWTANADGELVLTCPAVEGVEYEVTITNVNTGAQSWLQDSNDGTISVAVSANDPVRIEVYAYGTYDEEYNYVTPALTTALTGEFIFPIGTQMNPEALMRPNMIEVDIAAGNNQGYYYKWYANGDGTLKLTCPTVEGVEYDVILYNARTYKQASMKESTDGTVSLDVKSGDEVAIQVVTIPPEGSWDYPALATTLTGEFIFPVGSQMNPDILYRADYINVNIPAGNNQGYFYKWTAAEDGTLHLSCPNAEGVYDVNMTNMSTYAQAWLVDSTDGTISLAVSAGDEVIIQVTALPDAEWNYPALTVGLPGRFTYAAGHWSNPANLVLGHNAAVIKEGSMDGYHFTWTAEEDGVLTIQMPLFSNWSYAIGYDAPVDSDDEGVENPFTITVKAGETIELIVATYDPKNPSVMPAGGVAFTAKFDAAVAKIGDAIYGSVEDALAAAQDGETVALTANAECSEIKVAPGVTLDLNGKTLTAQFVSAFKTSNIVDNSADNTGVLVADPDCVMISATNSEMPIWNGNGYIFVDVLKFNETTIEGVYYFQPFFETIAHQYLIAGVEGSGITIALRLSWKGTTSEIHKDFIYTDYAVRDVINSYNSADNKYSKAFTAVVNSAGLSDLKMQVVLISDAGVEMVMN